MNYTPHDPDFWEQVDIKQVETMERKLKQLDPDYIEDLRDPLRAAAGILLMTVIAIVFWATLIGIVWLANAYL